MQRTVGLKRKDRTEKGTGGGTAAHAPTDRRTSLDPLSLSSQSILSQLCENSLSII